MNSLERRATFSYYDEGSMPSKNERSNRYDERPPEKEKKMEGARLDAYKTVKLKRNGTKAPPPREGRREKCGLVKSAARVLWWGAEGAVH